MIQTCDSPFLLRDGYDATHHPLRRLRRKHGEDVLALGPFGVDGIGARDAMLPWSNASALGARLFCGLTRGARRWTVVTWRPTPRARREMARASQ